MTELMVHLVRNPQRGRWRRDSVSIGWLEDAAGAAFPCPFTEKYRFRDVGELTGALMRYFGVGFTFRLIEPTGRPRVAPGLGLDIGRHLRGTGVGARSEPPSAARRT